jgi:hypothetical protein
VHNFSSSHERARFHDQSDFEAKRTVWGETVGPERLWRVDLPHELPSFDIPHEKGFRDLDYGRGRAMWAADLGRDGRPRKIRNTFVDAARDICSTLRDREATFGTSVGMGDCVQYTGTTLSRALGHRAFRPRSDETNFPTDIEPEVRTVELGEGFQIVIIATSNAGRTVSKTEMISLADKSLTKQGLDGVDSAAAAIAQLANDRFTTPQSKDPAAILVLFIDGERAGVVKGSDGELQGRQER